MLNVYVFLVSVSPVGLQEHKVFILLRLLNIYLQGDIWT